MQCLVVCVQCLMVSLYAVSNDEFLSAFSDGEFVCSV